MHKISNRIFEIFFKKTLDFLLAGFLTILSCCIPVTVVTLTVRRVFFDTLLCKIQHGLNLFHFVIVAFLRELGKCGGT